MKRILIAALVILSCSFLLTSCAGVSVSGRSTRYHYWYYPTAGIYFDYERKVYYYPDNGGWQRSERLPSKFSVEPTHIEIEADADKPYGEYEQHHRKYPGQHKQDDHNKGHRDDKNNGRVKFKGVNKAGVTWCLFTTPYPFCERSLRP